MTEFYDIGTTTEYPGGALSNFTEHKGGFVYDRVKCFTMEGFLQSLKFEDPARQKTICQMAGREAKATGNKNPRNWKHSGMLFWQGYMFSRHDGNYQTLLNEAYLALSRNAHFREALLATKDAKLIHSIGKTSAYKTVLTVDEFCGRLMVLREIIKSHYTGQRGIVVPGRGRKQ